MSRWLTMPLGSPRPDLAHQLFSMGSRSMPLSKWIEWAREKYRIELTEDAVRGRLRRGWSLEIALSSPVEKDCKQRIMTRRTPLAPFFADPSLLPKRPPTTRRST